MRARAVKSATENPANKLSYPRLYWLSALVVAVMTGTVVHLLDARSGGVKLKATAVMPMFFMAVVMTSVLGRNFYCQRVRRWSIVVKSLTIVCVLIGVIVGVELSRNYHKGVVVGVSVVIAALPLVVAASRVSLQQDLYGFEPQIAGHEMPDSAQHARATVFGLVYLGLAVLFCTTPFVWVFIILLGLDYFPTFYPGWAASFGRRKAIFPIRPWGIWTSFVIMITAQNAYYAGVINLEIVSTALLVGIAVIVPLGLAIEAPVPAHVQQAAVTPRGGFGAHGGELEPANVEQPFPPSRRDIRW